MAGNRQCWLMTVAKSRDKTATELKKTEHASIPGNLQIFRGQANEKQDCLCKIGMDGHLM